jgi:hypothetical protein
MTEGHRYNSIVAERITSQGILCTVPELYLVEDVSEIADMTKYEKDLVIDSIDEVIEVKSRNLWFTDDISTYPYNDIIVDTVSGYEAKDKKPLGYVFVSQKGNGMFCLPTNTKSTWKKKVLYDKYRGIQDTFYFADLDKCKTFNSLINHIQNRLEKK